VQHDGVLRINKSDLEFTTRVD